MRTNAAGLDIIKRFEGCRLEAYLPTPNDVPTIGFGRTRGVKMGGTCTEAEAEAWLREDVREAERAVLKINPPLNANQFSACVSLAFNIGSNAFTGSSLARKLEAEDYDGAAEQFARWNKQKGKVLAGLTRRRQAEEELFRRPMPNPLKKSRTIRAGTIAGATGLIGAVDQIDEVKSVLVDAVPYWQYAGIALAIVSVASIGIMLYARWDDHQKGLR